MQSHDEIDEIGIQGFAKKHGARFPLKRKLGTGGSGVTYLAHDALRAIDVCVKVYRNCHDEFVRRDWQITSTLKSDMLADTFHVELFDDATGATRVAAISRYIPGVNLGELLKGFGNLSSEKQRELHPVLVGEIADGLCDAVAFCHSKGHGHGELTVRNIMVTPLPSAVGRYASVVLIDFDNRSTFENRAINEAEFKASDCRQLRMLLGCLTDHTPYRDQVRRVLAASPDCHSVTEAFKACGRLFCGFQFPLVATQLDSDFWFTRLKEYVLLLVFQRFAPEWRAELDHLAETLDTVSSLQQARSRFDAWLADGGLDTFVPQATLTVTKQPIRDALQAIAAQTSSTTK